MKKAYLFLFLFALWTLASASWYLVSVKSDPTQAALAIIEILIMILVAVLLGFAIAWFLRDDKIATRQADINNLLADRELMLKEIAHYRHKANQADNQLKRAKESFHDDYHAIARERDQLKNQIKSQQSELIKLSQQLSFTQVELDNEKFKTQQLSQDAHNWQQQAHQKDQETAGLRYFINPFQIAATLESDDIDDLKKIKGIGPVIERKLNMLGIVSFKQISEFNKDAINQIAHTLKFFPDRIQRDRWIEQAREYAKNTAKK